MFFGSNLFWKMSWNKKNSLATLLETGSLYSEYSSATYEKCLSLEKTYRFRFLYNWLIVRHWTWQIILISQFKSIIKKIMKTCTLKKVKASITLNSNPNSKKLAFFSKREGTEIINYLWKFKLNLLYLSGIDYNSISSRIETYFTLPRLGRL